MIKRLWDKGSSPHEQVHKFTVGTDPVVDLRIVEWDLLASIAHAEGLARVGVLSPTELSSLHAALVALLDKAHQGEFSIPPELEDCHTAIEASLVSSLGEVGKKIHTGRSRNDQVLVALRLFVKNAVSELLPQLAELYHLVDSRIEQEGTVPMPGYTHFQRAMPASLGMWWGSYAEWVLEIMREGFSVLSSIDLSPLGVASGFGVPLALDRSYTAVRLGFSAPQRNPIYVQSSRGRFELRVVRWFSEIGGLSEKLACDLMLFTSSEFGFCSLPENLTTGSSIMPQKRNPDVVELMRATASKLRAAAYELEALVSKLPSSYHRDYQFTKEPLVSAQKEIVSLLPVVNEVVKAVTFHHGHLAAAMSSDLYATYEVYRKVRHGMSFREAYREVALQPEPTEASSASADFALIQQTLDAERAASRKEFESLRSRADAARAGFIEMCRSLRTPLLPPATPY